MTWRTILAKAPQVDDRNGVSYFDLPCKRLLNHARSPDLPFELSLNPYLNCEIACAYCFARDFTRRRQSDPEPEAFEREVYLKQDSPQVLRRELARLARAGDLGKPIAIGTATDPYQPVERRSRLTRALLEVLAEVGGVRVTLSTKSDLVARDIDVLQELGRSGHVRVSVSLTTPDRDLARTLEPRAPTPRKRLQAVEALARAGVPVGVDCMPILPDLTDDSRSLRHLVCATKDAGGEWFGARVLTLAGGVRPAFFAWLGRTRPGLVPRYRRWYRRGPRAPEFLREPIELLVSGLRAQYRIPESVPLPPARPPRERQLDLFTSPPASVLTGGAPSPHGRRAPRRLPLTLGGRMAS